MIENKWNIPLPEDYKEGEEIIWPTGDLKYCAKCGKLRDEHNWLSFYGGGKRTWIITCVKEIK